MSPDRSPDLAANLERLGRGLGTFQTGVAALAKAAAALEARVADLERQRLHAELESATLATQLVQAERQAARLMNLYVATYQLHATLDPAEVEGTIGDVALNLIGAERFVLLLKTRDPEGCQVSVAVGVGDAEGPFVGKRYAGGDPLIDATLLDGVLRLGPKDGSDAIAVVPLSVQSKTVGALVLLKLLEHKRQLTSEDRELLDLLGAHAASALLAAHAYSTTLRKLSTLEGLVSLVRRV